MANITNITKHKQPIKHKQTKVLTQNNKHNKIIKNKKMAITKHINNKQYVLRKSKIVTKLNKTKRSKQQTIANSKTGGKLIKKCSPKQNNNNFTENK